MGAWHIVTAEYPPQRGGVSDYTRGVAEGLAAEGEEVHVWCPGNAGAESRAGVVVHRALGRLAPGDLRRAGAALDAFPAPRRLLVQWVPHAYGFRSLNAGFCLWLWSRARRRGDRVEIMVHEPYLPFRPGAWRANVAAAGHRLMTTILLRAADRVWVATPAWARRWRRFALGRRILFEWIPIPSSVPVVDDPAAIATVRERIGHGDGRIVGHFGTCRGEVAEMLEKVFSRLLAVDPSVTVSLIGRGSTEFRSTFAGNHPSLADRVHATGGLSEEQISIHLSACDVLVQPYPDGINSRQSSAMAGLAHGRAIVTTLGEHTEDLWITSGAVALTAGGDAQESADRIENLLSQERAREELGTAARALYQSRFAMEHTLSALRREGG